MLVKIISIILENTYTTDDLIERLELMRVYYGKRIYTKAVTTTLDEVLASQCETHTLVALNEWEKRFVKDKIQPIIVYEALDTVQEEVSKLPSVVLYVPIRFSNEQAVRFGKWFRTNIQPNILLTLRIDPRAAGGCGFIWKNTYYDFSLRYYIQRNRDDLVSAFNTYIHA
jgi:hypothetical protein